LCNNAGVAAAGGIDDISLENWRWVLDVNLMGVVHGIRAFLPHIRAHGEGGHIVNTASMAGMNSGLGFSPYSASKFAVVNISEGLAARLKPLGTRCGTQLTGEHADFPDESCITTDSLDNPNLVPPRVNIHTPAAGSNGSFPIDCLSTGKAPGRNEPERLSHRLGPHARRRRERHGGHR
jgi:NAD(P)-dependent dehydrogenase (short-subunit alcohol dehydrogenase family)